jgi:hypothetical protein
MYVNVCAFKKVIKYDKMLYISQETIDTKCSHTLNCMTLFQNLVLCVNEGEDLYALIFIEHQVKVIVKEVNVDI